VSSEILLALTEVVVVLAVVVPAGWVADNEEFAVQLASADSG
jgi:hypothetical protein